MGALVGAIDSSAGNSSSSWTAKSADADLEGGPLLGAIALLGVNSPSSCLPTPRSGCRYTTIIVVWYVKAPNTGSYGELYKTGRPGLSVQFLSSDTTLFALAVVVIHHESFDVVTTEPFQHERHENRHARQEASSKQVGCQVLSCLQHVSICSGCVYVQIYKKE